MLWGNSYKGSNPFLSAIKSPKYGAFYFLYFDCNKYIDKNVTKGYFDENIAIQLLLPQNLKDQYAFKTEKALSMLEFSEVKFI